MNESEKNSFADAAYAAVDHPTVRQAMEEYAENMRFELSGLPAYGLEKVARYAAMVARCQAVGVDPDEMRLTPAESRSALLHKAADLVYEGIPTMLIEPCADCGGSGQVHFVNGGAWGNEAGWMKCPSCKASQRPYWADAYERLTGKEWKPGAIWPVELGPPPPPSNRRHFGIPESAASQGEGET